MSISNGHGFPVYELWSPEIEAPERSVFYVHGGAYVHPCDQRHWTFLTRLAGWTSLTRLADALGARGPDQGMSVPVTNPPLSDTHLPWTPPTWP